MFMDLTRRDGSNRCAGRVEIRDPAILTELAVWGFMLLLSLATAFFWTRWQYREPGIRKLLPWWTYPVALGLLAVSYVLDIPTVPIEICLGLDGTKLDYALTIAAGIATDLANFILLAIIIIPLTKQILAVTERTNRMLFAANITALALTGLLFVPYVVLRTIVMWSAYTTTALSPSSIHANVGMQVTYRLVFLIMSLSNAALLSFACAKPGITANHAALPRQLKFYAALTPIMFAISNLPPVIYWPIWGFSAWGLAPTERPYAAIPFIVNTVVSNLCLTLTFILLLLTARVATTSALPNRNSILDFDMYYSTSHGNSGTLPKRMNTNSSNRSRYSFHSAITSPGSEAVPDMPDIPPIDLQQAAPHAFRPDRRRSGYGASSFGVGSESGGTSPTSPTSPTWPSELVPPVPPMPRVLYEPAGPGYRM